MKVSITFSELQDYLLDHFHKSVKMAYVDGSTTEISVPVKVLGFTKFVGIRLTVKKIEGTDLFLAYDGKMGVDMLVTPAIAFIKKLIPEKTNWVQSLPNNMVKIYLGDIEQLSKIFEKVKLNSISFEQLHVVIETTLL